jgi:hypothetical protein
MHDLLANLGTIIIAATALFALIGGGFRFVWKKIEVRFEKIEKALEECRERDLKKDRQLSTVVLCIKLLVPEVERLDPNAAVNHTLRQVRSELGRLFPVDPQTPPDMSDILDRMP